MKAALTIMLTLALLACAAPQQAPQEMPQDAAEDTALDPNLHGTAPTDTPNVAGEKGALETRGEMVAYYGEVEGYFARPADDNVYPGVVMIHEWWGLNDNIKMMADVLASEGYEVLAVDLYEGQVAATSDEARALVGGFDQQQGLANLKAASAYLREQGSPRIASLGWCFGGGQSLQLGMAEDLDATVIYYGSLVTDEARLASIEQPVLGLFGSEDQGIPVSSVNEFDAALDSLGVENEIVIYEGANHAFANPSGDRFKPDAAEDAWSKTIAFLEENLQG